jgi:O-antigen/teichoic acid export membrane protein
MAALRLAAFGMRAASAAAKFLLVMYIASSGDSVLMGEVAIITTVVALFTQIAGLEVNQVVGRRLHGLSPVELVRTLQGQVLLCVLAYVVLIAVALIAYPDLFLAHWLCVALILMLEHFVTEVYRLNILMLRSVYASCLLFIKNAGWVVLFFALSALDKRFLTLPVMLYCWAGILVLVAVPLFAQAWNAQQHHGGFSLPIAWRRGPELIREARPFIFAAVLTGLIGAIDKLIISKVFSLEQLGVYFFFSTCASILGLVVSFGVGSTAGPECIKVHTIDGEQAFLRRLKRLKAQYTMTIGATALVIIGAAGPLLELFGKRVYALRLDILVLLVGSAAFVSLCDPYKLEEYLAKRDSSLVIGNTFHGVSLFALIALGASTRDIDVVAACVLAASVLTFLFFCLGGPQRTARFLGFQR